MTKRSTLALQQANDALAHHDASLWGALAQEVARERLGWIDLPEKSREHLPALDALSAWSRSVGRTRFVLAGMGGSSLAPAVIAQTYKQELIILDSTHPDDVHAVLDPVPDTTLFIVSSKSGETIETRTHLKAITERLSKANLILREHLVIVTDPQSPLAAWAIEHDVRIFYGEPTVGGRFSALSVFGLVPAALIGVDCAALLDEAADMKAALESHNPHNLAIEMAEEILAAEPFLDLPATPLSDWVEQLVAESTGKEGRGIVPAISPTPQLLTSVKAASELSLGASFYLWEWTTALLGYALDVNPFDQPNVASAKEATRQALSKKRFIGSNAFRTSDEVLSFIENLRAAKNEEVGYLALLCYLPMQNPEVSEHLNMLRVAVQQKFAHQKQRVLLGFGPRYLHSTGQCHKGGPAIGTFLIITSEAKSDYVIDGENYSFAELINAQALGDIQTLTSIGQQVAHAHLDEVELEKLSRALHVTS